MKAKLGGVNGERNLDSRQNMPLFKVYDSNTKKLVKLRYQMFFLSKFDGRQTEQEPGRPRHRNQSRS